MRDARGGGLAGDQLGDRDAAADVDMALRAGGERVLEDRAPAGERDEPLVTRPRRAVHNEGWQQRHRVERRGAGAPHRLDHVGQVAVQDLAPARMQVVRLSELRDAAAVPVPPGVSRRAGHGVTVALQDRDFAAVFGEHQRGRQADETAPYHDNPWHEIPPASRIAQ
jgi:hypothetical protein